MDRCHYLLYEDFKDFPLGEFPYDRDHSAMGEYHYVVEEGYRGVWNDPVCNYTYNGSGPSWIITEAMGKHYMEQMRIEKDRPHTMYPTLQAGDIHWKNYTMKAVVRRLSTKGEAGIAFSMTNSLNTLAFILEGAYAKLVYRHKEEVTILAEAPYPHDADTYYTMKVLCDGELLCCYIDDIEVLRYTSYLVARGGKVGITANCPTQFTDIAVSVDEDTLKEIEEDKRKERIKISKLQQSYPAMKLYKKIDLKDFGTSRQIRFGHLTGTKEWHIVLAQAQKRVHRDAYAHINCITAIDLDGNILWQRGEPSANSNVLGKIAADLPIQVYDIDGDGIDEVITAINFELLILDGRTGEVKCSCKTPLSQEEDKDLLGVPYGIYAFDRINPDCIRIANFSGNKRSSDILIKDRYCRVYAYNSQLELLWKYHSPKNTGHYPLALDINGDGRDELLCGYTLLDSYGQEVWTYPIEADHTDEIVAGKFMAGSDKGYFACVSGTEGFFIGDFQGNIIKRDYIGHGQRISIGNYSPEREGFDIIVSNYWGHQGILYYYDCFGNPLWELETGLNGNILTPVNWLGNGTDFILLNADPKKGGLINGDGDQVVAFPNDGHPTLCCEAIDLIGDQRDELVVWDYKSLWIYTQEDNGISSDYYPVKYPIYNASNYRGEYSFPNKSYISFKEKIK